MEAPMDTASTDTHSPALSVADSHDLIRVQGAQERTTSKTSPLRSRNAG